ncbi:MAG TPA: ABC transporter substrate-binding protein [Polyangiaceae bacterium]|nr:ABC transporter substrate-binding protein [Polyangiaceae bacterium]
MRTRVDDERSPTARPIRQQQLGLRRGRSPLGAAGLLLGALACSSPDIEGMVFSCETNSDCLAGRVCGERDGVRACVPADQSPISIGMTGPFRGPSGELGVELRRGILAEFERVNAEGGVSGRRLQLDSKNDDYDPNLALEAVEALLDIRELAPRAGMPDVRGPNGVFALLGSIGTATTLATAPLANRNGVVLFSPFTGAHDYLRDGTRAPYIYNFRPGYFDETEVLVDYMASQRQPRIISTPPGDSYRRLLVFAQNDSYGDAGYAGIVDAYNRRAPLPQPDPSQPNPSIARIGYDREDMASVEPAIERAIAFLSALLDETAAPASANVATGSGAASVSVGIIMIDTYQPANQFIRAVKDWLNADATRASRLDVLFSHVSFVGADALAALLSSPPSDYADVTNPARRKSYADGVLITEVVPSFESEALGIAGYRRDIDRFDGGNYGFTSLEGYLTARLFTQALGLCPELSTESLRNTLDTRLTDVDLGIGVKVGFSSIDHQASHTVWGSILRADGRIDVPFMWTPETGIRPN